MKLSLGCLSSFVLMALLQSATASAAPSVTDVLDSERATQIELGGRACGTADAPRDVTDAALGRVRAQRSRSGLTVQGGGVIDVAFHNITNGAEGFVSRRTFMDQIQALNERYAGSGFSFRLRSIDRVDRNRHAYRPAARPFPDRQVDFPAVVRDDAVHQSQIILQHAPLFEMN